MLEIKVTRQGEGHDVQTVMEGSSKELVIEALAAIGGICAGMDECCGPIGGAIFRSILEAAVQDKNSPIWTVREQDKTLFTFDKSLFQK